MCSSDLYGVLVLQIVTKRRECFSDDINTVNLLTEVRADFTSVSCHLFSAYVILHVEAFMHMNML